MKLPFKFAKFGKKANDDDEDDDEDSGFDPSELEGDPDVDLGEATVSLGEESIEGEAASDDLPGGDEGEALPSEKFRPEAQNKESPSEDEGQGAPEGKGNSSASEEVAEDINFSDDDDDDNDDDDDDDDVDNDDDDDDDDGGGGKPKKKLLIVGGGATAALLLIGGVSWYLMFGDSGDELASKENSNIPIVAMDIAPKAKPKAGGLNAILAGPPDGDVAPTELLAQIISPMAFASLAQPKVTDSPLGASNDPALSEESPQGLLPITAKDGRQAWQVYAKPFENQNSNPRVAIVVRGLGQSKSATDAAIRLLPGNVTLAFDPYAPNLSDWIEKARAAGHEVMVMVPLEPTTFPFDDPGPLGLMTINAPEENLLRLENILSRMTGYIGVMTVMGSKFNTSDKHLRAFLGEIKKRGLMLLEGAVNSKSLAPKIAAELSLPRAVTNVVLDLIPTKAEIDVRLAELETVLAGQPTAVAIAEGYPSSIERIAVWTAGLQAKNLVLAPLSALADKQFLE